MPQFVLNAAGDGSAKVNATITDTAGNISQSSAATYLNISNTAPTFIENGSSVALFTHRTGLDASTDTLINSVKISITYALGDGTDQLTFTDSSKVHGSFDINNCVLKL